MALIHLEDSEGLAVKSTGRVALISPVEVGVEVGLDIAGKFILGGMVVAGLTGVGVHTETLGVVAASRGFSRFRSRIMLSGS